MISEKKISCRLISKGKKQAKKFLGKAISCTEKNISLITYEAEKNLTPLYVREKISNSLGLGKK